jgi:signal transduction histidine kinase
MKGATGPVVVVFVTDISERREGELRILEYQEKLRRMAFDTALSEDRERRRIAANLHDGVGQTLALAQNKLSSVRSSLEGDTRTTLDECVRFIEEAIAQTRTLTFDLSPPILYDLGLEPALRWLAEQMEKRYAIHIEFAGYKTLWMDPDVAAIVFRCVRELLTNIFKHASTRTARVTLSQNGDRVGVMVEDHGSGFDVLRASRPRSGIGFGLFSVREQIERLGGSMSVQSAPGQGTRVALVVPSSRPKEESA